MKRKIATRLSEYGCLERCCLDDCRAACCLHGVWIDLEEVKLILNNVGLIACHMPENHRDPRGWFEDRYEEDPFTSGERVRHSVVLKDPEHYGGTACIFLRQDNKCALQVAGEAAKYHPWHFKPFYCILHPLDLTEDGSITLDKTELLLEEKASCVRKSGDSKPLFEIFSEELRYLAGEDEYNSFRQGIDSDQNSPHN